MDFRPYQQAALDAIVQAIKKDLRIIKVEMTAGTGKTAVFVALIRQLYSTGNSEILVLTSQNVLLEQISSSLHEADIRFNVDNKKNASILLTTYARLQRAIARGGIEQSYRYILFFDIDNTVNMALGENKNTTLIGFTNINKASKGLFQNIEPVFRYALKDAVKDGYLDELSNPQLYGYAVEGFCLRLFTSIGFKIFDVTHESKPLYPDLVVSTQDGLVLIEVKAYRNKPVSATDINRAISQMLRYKHFDFQHIGSRISADCCLILFGKVSEDQKAMSYKEYGVTIWDISNILFFIRDNPLLLDELMRIALFPISSFTPIPPIGWGSTLGSIESSKKPTMTENDIAIDLERRLHNCKPGKSQALEYESICSDILSYLFGSEFTFTSRQHITGDELFRMDMLCTLKGTSAFWELLIEHYNSRFVVFEYKNHTSTLSQNLVFITEKYLFNAALRNVAIIISRNGFSKNADVAAKGCLKENGKLIIDITDQDLVLMLKRKATGEEPSDYLLEKTESFLMSISK